MHSDPHKAGAAAPFTLSGVRAGALGILPLLPGLAVFGAAFGAVAAQKGLTLFEAMLMSALVIAGASQLVGMEIWRDPLGFGTIVGLALVTALVNARMLLMSASLYPWLSGTHGWQSYPTLLLLTDVNWIAAMRRRGEGYADAGWLLGSGLAVWLLWIAATGIGHVFGALIAQPRLYAVDLILPIFFCAMLVPLWRGPRRAVPWVIAGAVALLVQRLVPGFWYIVAGALAGALAGGLIDERK